jgi:hypothetical protein
VNRPFRQRGGAPAGPHRPSRRSPVSAGTKLMLSSPSLLVRHPAVRDNTRQTVRGATSEVVSMVRTQSKSGGVASIDVDEVLRDYEQERISLGRLAELLGINRDEATRLVQSRGLPLRIGPNTIEEAREEVRALRKIQSR